MSEQKQLIGKLYLIPTPIGNLDEISPRIKKTVEECDLIYSEDTRNTKKLLSILSIKKETRSLHEHNESSVSDDAIRQIESGKIVGYMSDAGFPAISDPGKILVQKAIDKGIVVTPISGPCAFIDALVASYQDSSHFLFYGFLKSSSGERKKELESLKNFPNTIIFYESPHRINKTLNDIYSVFGDRNMTIAREISKLHEEFIYGKISKLKDKEYIGEIVLVIDGKKNIEETRKPIEEIKDLYKGLLEKKLTSKDAIKSIAVFLNIPKNEVYKYLVSQNII
jgi:16S rRNA (cytidine1402-2'-O)-methyltransferase